MSSVFCYLSLVITDSWFNRRYVPQRVSDLAVNSKKVDEVDHNANQLNPSHRSDWAASCSLNKPIMLTLRCASGCKLTRVKEDFWCWLDLQVSLNFWSFWSIKHIIYMTSLKVVERQPAWQLSVRNLGFILRNGSTQLSRLATIILQYHITSLL